MGDAPMAFVETTGGVRVAGDDLVSVGRNDVSLNPGNESFSNGRF